MIIDCHGHYTTEPKDLHRFRKEQTEAANAKDKGAMPPRAALKMSDDEIRESIEQNQLKLQKERGTDLTIFSPRASGMGHHIGDESVSTEWSEICNDLIARVVSLYPKNFIGVCQLPQSPGVIPKNSSQGARALREDGLRRLQPQSRSVRRLFQLAADDRQVVVSVLREDDRAGRARHDPRLGLLQSGAAHHRLVLSQRRHDGVHAGPPVRPVQGVSRSCKFIIPHGGGAVPFHWGRFRGIALNNGKPELAEIMGKTSSSTPASIISRASTCSPRWCRSTTSCSPRRWSAR